MARNQGERITSISIVLVYIPLNFYHWSLSLLRRFEK